MASKWLLCIILTGHEVSDGSLNLIHTVCLDRQNDNPMMASNCLFALDFLSNYKKLSPQIVKTITSSNLLKVYRQQKSCDKYDRDTLQQLLLTFNRVPNDRQNAIEIQNILCAITKMIELNTEILEEQEMSCIETALSGNISHIHECAVNKLKSELNGHKEKGRVEPAAREFDAANTRIRVRAEVTATSMQAVHVMHGDSETAVEDITEANTDASKESEHGKQTTPDVKDKGDNWTWWRTTHSQLEKYERMIKNVHMLTVVDIDYIGKKMFGWRTSLQFEKAQQDMEQLIAWLLAALAKQAIPLPKQVKDKVQKYINGKTQFTPDNPDEYNQQMILILNKFVEQGSKLDEKTVAAIQKSFTKYPETIILLDNIVSDHPVDVNGLENKILDRDPETCRRTCRLYFEAAKRGDKLSSIAIENLTSVACGKTFENTARQNALAGLSWSAKYGNIQHATLKKLCDILEDESDMPLGVKMYTVHCMYNASLTVKFSQESCFLLCELVCNISGWDNAWRQYEIFCQVLQIQIEKHKNSLQDKMIENLSALLLGGLNFDILNRVSWILFYVIKNRQTLSSPSLDHFCTYLLAEDPELCGTIAEAFVEYFDFSNYQECEISGICLEALASIHLKPVNQDLQQRALRVIQRAIRFKTILPKPIVNVLCRSLDHTNIRVRQKTINALQEYTLKSDQNLSINIVKQLGDIITNEPRNIQLGIIQILANEGEKWVLLPQTIFEQLQTVMCDTATCPELRSTIRMFLQMSSLRQNLPMETLKVLDSYSDAVILSTPGGSTYFNLGLTAERLRRSIMVEQSVLSAVHLSQFVHGLECGEEQSTLILDILHEVVQKGHCLPVDALMKLQEYVRSIEVSDQIEHIIVRIIQNKQRIDKDILDKLMLNNKLVAYEAISECGHFLDDFELNTVVESYDTCPLLVLKILENIVEFGQTLSESQSEVIQKALQSADESIVKTALKVIENQTKQQYVVNQYDEYLVAGLKYILETWEPSSNIYSNAMDLLDIVNHALDQDANHLCLLNELSNDLQSTNPQVKSTSIDLLVDNPMLSRMNTDKCIPALQKSEADICKKALTLLQTFISMGGRVASNTVQHMQNLMFSDSFEEDSIDILSACQSQLLEKISLQATQNFILRAKFTENVACYRNLLTILKGLSTCRDTGIRAMINTFLTMNKQVEQLILLCMEGDQRSVFNESSKLYDNDRQHHNEIPITKILGLTELLWNDSSHACAAQVLGKVLSNNNQEISGQALHNLLISLDGHSTNVLVNLTSMALAKAPITTDIFQRIVAVLDEKTLRLCSEVCKRIDGRKIELDTSFFDKVSNLVSSRMDLVKGKALDILLSIAMHRKLPPRIIGQVVQLMTQRTGSTYDKALLIGLNHLRHVTIPLKENDKDLERSILESIVTKYRQANEFVTEITKRINCDRGTKLHLLSVTISCPIQSLTNEVVQQCDKLPLLSNINLIQTLAQVQNVQEHEIQIFQQLIMSQLQSTVDTQAMDNILLAIVQKCLTSRYSLTMNDLIETLSIVTDSDINALDIIQRVHNPATKNEWISSMQRHWLRTKISLPYSKHLLDIPFVTIRELIQFSRKIKNEILSDILWMIFSFFQEHNYEYIDRMQVLNSLREGAHDADPWKTALEYSCILKKIDQVWSNIHDNQYLKLKDIITDLLKLNWSADFFIELCSIIERRYVETTTRTNILDPLTLCLQKVMEFGVDEKNQDDFLKIFREVELTHSSRNCIPPMVVETHKLCIKASFKSIVEDKDLDTLLSEMSKSNGMKYNMPEIKKFFREIEQSGNSYSQILEMSDHIINEWAKHDIFNWAKKLRQLEGQTEDNNFLPEMLAVLKRAMNLHKGFEPRLAQVLTIYAMLKTKCDGRGFLAQIKTGEGKSAIIALLAAIKGLQGKTVDIVTSSSELAKRDAIEWTHFYAMFGLTVSDNTRDMYSGKVKECYKADIVYGDSGNFQFDILRHEYSQMGTRGTRGFEVVIVDEVDNMLIDDGDKIAKLATEIPGMNWLLPLFAVIWIQLEQFCLSLVEQQIKNEEKLQAAENYVLGTIRDMVNDDIIKIPRHLAAYFERQLPKYVLNAIVARFHYRINEQYIIERNVQGIRSIIPVDYGNTGVVQASTVWSDGLHQFLQLKHHLQLTPESLTTNFMSNMAFLRRYGENIFGMTGTLGSIASQDLLKHCYQVDTAIIPSYRPKQFIEFKSIIAADETEWIEEISKEAQHQVEMKRSVLVICNTIAQTKRIVKHLRERTRIDSSKIKKYSRNDLKTEINAVHAIIQAGEIIIATNLAGRGTDINTSSVVENNGGLHVILTFIPRNLRVEEQALGRTSRQGKCGTGRLILNKDDIKLAYPELPESSINEKVQIQHHRDALEKSELDDLEGMLPLSTFKDNLFQQFCALLTALNTGEDPYKKAEIEESWGLLLKSLNLEDQRPEQNTLQTAISNAQKQFDDFKTQIKDEYYQPYQIFRNPCYLMKKGNDLLKNWCFWKQDAIDINLNFNSDKKLNQAMECYEHAIQLDPLFSYNAYYTTALIILQMAKGSDYEKDAIKMLNRCSEKTAEIIAQSDCARVLINVAHRDTGLYHQLKNEFIIRDTFRRSIDQCLVSIHKHMRYIDIDFHSGENSEIFYDLDDKYTCLQLIDQNWNRQTQHVSISFHGLEKHSDTGTVDQAAQTIAKTAEPDQISITYNSLQSPVILDVYREIQKHCQPGMQPECVIIIEDLPRLLMENVTNRLRDTTELLNRGIKIEIKGHRLIEENHTQVEWILPDTENVYSLYSLHLSNLDESKVEYVMKCTDNQPVNLICHNLRKKQATSLITAIDNATGNGEKCDIHLEELSAEDVHDVYTRTREGKDNQVLCEGMRIALCETSNIDGAITRKETEIKSSHGKIHKKVATKLNQTKRYTIIYRGVNKKQFEHVVVCRNEMGKMGIKANHLTAHQTNKLLNQLKTFRDLGFTSIQSELLIEGLEASELSATCRILREKYPALQSAEVSLIQSREVGSIQKKLKFWENATAQITETVCKEMTHDWDFSVFEELPEDRTYAFRFKYLTNELMGNIAKKDHVPVSAAICLTIQRLGDQNALTLINDFDHLTNGNNLPVYDSRDFVVTIKTDNKDRAKKLICQAKRARQPLQVKFMCLKSILKDISHDNFKLFYSEGFYDIMDIIEKHPRPWRSCLIVAVLGTLQIAGGVALCVTGVGVPWGLGFIFEGVGDYISIAFALGTRSFSWKMYAGMKTLSLAVTVASCGVSQIKAAVKAARAVQQTAQEVGEEAVTTVIENIPKFGAKKATKIAVVTTDITTEIAIRSTKTLGSIASRTALLAWGPKLQDVFESQMSQSNESDDDQ